MGESQIKIGDKFFLYGQLTKYITEPDTYEYNTVMGYLTTGGYFVNPIETDIFSAAIPGFVTEILYDASFTVATPFNQMEMVDVTDKLSLQSPRLSGTKVWMPIPNML